MLKKYLTFILVFSIFFILSCENPFGDDEIKGENRTISGTVKAQNSESVSGVYVWLEQIDVGTFTNSKGEFALTLPPKAAINNSGQVNGSYKVYFYAINYHFQTREIIFQNGAVLYGQGDINKDGSLSQNVNLLKIFNVVTELSPDEIDGSDNQKLSIVSRITANSDSVTINIPNGSSILLGGVFFKNVNTQKIYISRLESGKDLPYLDTVSKKEKLWSFHPNVRVLNLPAGFYEVIPHIYPYFPEIPSEIYYSMGLTPYEMNENYLKLLFNLKKTILRVAS